MYVHICVLSPTQTQTYQHMYIVHEPKLAVTNWSYSYMLHIHDLSMYIIHPNLPKEDYTKSELNLYLQECTEVAACTCILAAILLNTCTCRYPGTQ